VPDQEMDAEKLYQRYKNLQRYVDWTEEDATRVRSAFELVRPFFVELIDDFTMRSVATQRRIRSLPGVRNKSSG
jgi:hypothetical protein